MSLKADIRDTELRIAARRSRVRVAASGVKRTVRTRMVAPRTLITAGLLGAALHRDHRTKGLRALALLQAMDSAVRRWSALASWVPPPAAMH